MLSSALKATIPDKFIHKLSTIKRYSGAKLVPDLIIKVHLNPHFKVFIGNQKNYVKKKNSRIPFKEI